MPCAACPSATPEELARRSGAPRALRARVAGRDDYRGVVEVDPARVATRLPPEHAAFLTRAAGADNVAVFAQYIALLGSSRTTMVGVLREGRRCAVREVPALPRRHGGGQRASVLIVSGVAHPAAGLGAGRSPAQGMRVLDVGCGSGRVPIGWPSCSRRALSTAWICPRGRSGPRARLRPRRGWATSSSRIGT